jgi:hypothetical protein
VHAPKLVFVLIVFLVLTSCSNQDLDPVPTFGVYQPPTSAPTEASFAPPPQDAESESLPGEIEPSPTPSCFNNLLFLDDLTIPDGTVVIAGERLDKRWLVQNNGTCNWNDQYQVRLIAGSGLGMPVEQKLYPALSGADVVIRMVFIAPSEPGSHRSAWQAYNAQGDPFGDPFFIDILVSED